METVRNQLKLPRSVTNEKLGRGQFSFRIKENMLVVLYQDKKAIFQLSTMHKADFVNVRKQSHGDVDVQKPKSYLRLSTIIKKRALLGSE